MKLIAGKIISEFGGTLIEEYIDGREYTVLVIENEKDKYNPFVLGPIECEFHNGETFKHFDLKFKTFKESLRLVNVDNIQIRTSLMEMAKKAFIYMNGKSFARVDIRADRNQRIYFLEINAQPMIFWNSPDNDENNADFIIKHNTLFKPDEVVYQIIHLGLVEFKKRQLPYYVSLANGIYNGQGKLLIKKISLEISRINSFFLNIRFVCQARYF